MDKKLVAAVTVTGYLATKRKRGEGKLGDFVVAVPSCKGEFFLYCIMTRPGQDLSGLTNGEIVQTVGRLFPNPQGPGFIVMADSVRPLRNEEDCAEDLGGLFSGPFPDSPPEEDLPTHFMAYSDNEDDIEDLLKELRQHKPTSRPETGTFDAGRAGAAQSPEGESTRDPEFISSDGADEFRTPETCCPARTVGRAGTGTAACPQANGGTGDNVADGHVDRCARKRTVEKPTGDDQDALDPPWCPVDHGSGPCLSGCASGVDGSQGQNGTRQSQIRLEEPSREFSRGRPVSADPVEVMNEESFITTPLPRLVSTDTCFINGLRYMCPVFNPYTRRLGAKLLGQAQGLKKTHEAKDVIRTKKGITLLIDD